MASRGLSTVQRNACLATDVTLLARLDTNDLYLDAPVFSASGTRGITRDRLTFAFAVGVNPVPGQALAFEETLYRLCSASRKILIVFLCTDGVGMPHGDHDFQRHLLEPGSDFAQFALSLRFQLCLIKIKIGVGVEGNLLGWWTFDGGRNGFGRW